MLNVCEIFTSIQGESALAGHVCTFVRLAGCNLRCVWCDTVYSHDEGAGIVMSVDDIVGKVAEVSVDLVEITGGEPLLQPDAVDLCEKLLRRGYRVMVETNGSVNIGVIPQNVRRVIDIKCPGSGSGGSFLVDNLGYVNSNDEIKFVLASLDDAVWAKGFCDCHRLTEKCHVTFSPVQSGLPADRLAGWMVGNNVVNIRLGVQLHKIIWGERRGV